MIFFLADLFVSNPLLNVRVEQIKMGTNTSTHEEFSWENSCGFEVQPSLGQTFLQFSEGSYPLSKEINCVSAVGRARDSLSAKFLSKFKV